ncbi:MAG: DUF4132 domain-containing protein, partial [Phycisphaerales bacterium JB039]
WHVTIDHEAVLPIFNRIRQSPPEVQVGFIRLGLDQIARIATEGDEPVEERFWELVNFHHTRSWATALSHMLAFLLKRELPFTNDDLLAGVRSCNEYSVATESWMPHIRALCRVLEKRFADSTPPPDLAQAMTQLGEITMRIHNASEHRLGRRFLALAGGPPPLPMLPGEAWSNRAMTDLRAMPEPRRRAWIDLLDHCQGARSANPSANWVRGAGALLAPVDRFADTIIPWLALVDKPSSEQRHPLYAGAPDPTHLIIDPHADLLKGLCWACAQVHSPDLTRALGALAISCYRKVPGIGPRAVRIGNAAVWALGQTPGPEALGQLAMLRIKVKFGGAQKAIEKALDSAAAREGLPREEVEELAVPAYGLTDVGRREERLGEYTAELVIEGAAAELRWRKADGKLQKSVPAAVKRDHGDDLKELKAAAKDIQKMLPAQRDRIDQLFCQRKSWPVAQWRERYLDHPLVGVIARRLIWTIRSGDETRDVIWVNGEDGAGGSLMTLSGTPVEPGASGTGIRAGRGAGTAPPTVELWHPLGRDTADVLAWREFLEKRRIRQPFKQAHREVYLLTDAERTTNVYSNRYAAHILRQHQFHALCAARGWKNQLRLLVDQEFPPATRLLAQWGLRAEFWIEGAGDEYGKDTNENATFHYLVTDQVRFYPLNAAPRMAHAGGGGYSTWGAEGSDTPIPLEQVPALVFSEIMRDVDLFVGVASVGNNPEWSDGGPEGRYREYWHDFSFGELSATAETRREILERLLPRLKIAPQCELDGRFLRICGTRRTYRIHLGSSNILMEPGDAYLCIVPSGRQAVAGGDIWLPFEGDRTLSVILSKALLLAADDKITDRTILSQIGR